MSKQSSSRNDEAIELLKLARANLRGAWVHVQNKPCDCLGCIRERIDAFITRSETEESIGAAWLVDNLTYMKEPLVNARTGEEIKGEVLWTIWWNGPDAATFREALHLRTQGKKV